MKRSKKIKQKKPDGPGSGVMSRAYFVFVLMFVFALLIIFKVAYIQIVEGAALRLKAEQGEYKYVDVDAVRGNIFSSGGNLLATSVPIFEIRMDPLTNSITDKLFADSVTWLARDLARIFGNRTQWGYKQLLIKARRDSNRYVLIKKYVSLEQLNRLKTFPIFCRGKYKGGLIALAQTRREYPYGELAKRTIGYSKSHANLYVGLEGHYNEYLKGVKGKQIKQKMASGDWKPFLSDKNIEPVNGKDVITTIDVYLQDVAESSLLRHLILNEAQKGTVILVEVSTGEVKAIANLQLDEKDGTYKELLNTAIGEAFEPGSIFKLPSLMVAMEDGIIGRTDSVEIGDGWTMYYGQTMKDSHVIDKDGWITPKESFVHSSNVAVSRIIADNYLGKEWEFVNGLKKLHLDEKLGIEISGEAAPFINNPKRTSWSKVSLPWMSIGYEVMVTPLQMLTLYNAVANDGVMVKPRFVKEIRDAGKTIKRFEPVIIDKQICSGQTIKMAKAYLEGVVESGTARNINNSVYKIAGKTGTAQIAGTDGYGKKNYNASFIGYFPAEKPKYSCIVLIHKPKAAGYYATTVAAPVFKEIADIVYAQEMDIHPRQDNVLSTEAIAENAFYNAVDLTENQNSTPDELTLLVKTNQSVPSFEEFMKMKKVPDVTGLALKDAVYLLENLGLKTSITGKGKVNSQSIKAGSPLRRGDMVQLVLKM